VNHAGVGWVERSETQHPTACIKVVESRPAEGAGLDPTYVESALDFAPRQRLAAIIADMHDPHLVALNAIVDRIGMASDAKPAHAECLSFASEMRKVGKKRDGNVDGPANVLRTLGTS